MNSACVVDEHILVGLDLASLDVEPVAGILWQLTWRDWRVSCGVFKLFVQIDSADLRCAHFDFSGFFWYHLGPQDYEKLLAEAAQVPSEDLSRINIRGWLLSVPCSMSLWIIWIPDLLGCSMLFISLMFPCDEASRLCQGASRRVAISIDPNSPWLTLTRGAESLRPRWAWGADGVSGGSQRNCKLKWAPVSTWNCISTWDGMLQGWRMLNIENALMRIECPWKVRLRQCGAYFYDLLWR